MLVLETLWNNERNVRRRLDATGVEAFVNKIHVDDFAPTGASDHRSYETLVFHAVGGALLLARRLRRRARCRLVLFMDPATRSASLQFVRRRRDVIWGPRFEDLDEDVAGELVVIDT